MGILDEAIRQHLELKRRRGATDSELQRLEDEAFGPPSRPGEPDFPEHEGESAEQSGNGVAREGAVAEAPVAPEAPIPPPPEGEQFEHPDEPDEQDAAEEPTAIHDQGPGSELELGELGLELDEEGPPAEEPAASDEPRDAEASEPPIETLDTVEHELPEREGEPEAAPSEEPIHEQAEEPEPSEQEPGPAGEGEETSEEGESQHEEDVLADTPDFLKDAPEDDELWFEQGKPKDFDF
jgi:hypothetical protein